MNTRKIETAEIATAEESLGCFDAPLYRCQRFLTILTFESSRSLASLSQLSLQRLQFSARGVAEVSQWIFTARGRRLHLLRRQVRLRVGVHDKLTTCSAATNTCREEPKRMRLNSAYDGMRFLGSLKLCSKASNHEARAFIDEARI